VKVNGACHCGQIKYEAEVDPERVSVCHCSDCQVLTGSPFRVSIPALPDTFRLLSGNPKSYVKVAESGNRRRHAFCPNCGSPVFATPDDDNPSRYTLRVGGLAQRAHLPPKSRIWCKSAVAWSQDIGALPGTQGQ
jgi:hypothetical protein